MPKREKVIFRIHGRFEAFTASTEATVFGPGKALGAKPRALLAILLRAEDFRTTRGEMQALLWSDRGYEQAQASLRQAIAQIRRAFDGHDGLFHADRVDVWLDPEGFSVAETDDGELFQDLHLRDKAFVDWLRRERFMDARNTDPAHRNIKTLVYEQNGADRDTFSFAHRIASNVAEWVPLELRAGEEARELGAESNADLHIAVRDNAVGGGFEVLTRSRGRTISFGTVSGAEPGHDPDIARMHMINNVTGHAIHAFSGSADSMRNRAADDMHFKTPFDAICALFGMRGKISASLRAYFQNSFDEDKRGIYLAWLAFELTYAFGEGHGDCPEATKEEARELVARAIESEPMNSMVLALSSYVFGFLLNDHATSRELAARAVRLNSTNALAWAFLGAANCYLGEYEKAREQTNYARAVCSEGPHRYLVDILSMIAATLTGHLQEALGIGTCVELAAPDYRPPLRYAYAIHAKTDDQDRLWQTKKRLTRLESGFSGSSLFEDGYPAAALQRSGFLKDLQVSRNWV